MSQAMPTSISYTNSNLFSGYYLDERVDAIDAWNCDEEARAVFEELQALWDAEGDLVRSYNEDELLGSWIDPVLAHLGYDSLSETTVPDGGGYNDRLLFESPERRREAASEKRDGRGEGMYRLASALLEAKQWDANFTERFSDERSYRDASHQVKYYLERTPDELGWGVLTNGRTWRLYGTKDYETSTYYEVDLVNLLESGDVERFKYFYVFFRPAAFRGSVGETFLDRVWAESESPAQELGADLQDNVETKKRAEELDEKIERTDQLIDEIVYELYGLTDEEIEIVENAVGGD